MGDWGPDGAMRGVVPSRTGLPIRGVQELEARRGICERAVSGERQQPRRLQALARSESGGRTMKDDSNVVMRGGPCMGGSVSSCACRDIGPHQQSAPASGRCAKTPGPAERIDTIAGHFGRTHLLLSSRLPTHQILVRPMDTVFSERVRPCRSLRSARAYPHILPWLVFVALTSGRRAPQTMDGDMAPQP
jgi:hypothetical protein